MDKKQPQIKMLPYLEKIRIDLVRQLNEYGLSAQSISDIFSVGITKQGIHQMLKKNETKK